MWDQSVGVAASAAICSWQKIAAEAAYVRDILRIIY